MSTAIRRLTLTLWLPLLLCGQSLRENLKEFEKNVTEFTLKNGMHFIVLERHQAPVVSFHMYVNAGAANDPAGRTGIAHMFEHMIGKGTTTVGTKNWPEEKKALDRVNAIYAQLEEERNKEYRANPEVLRKLQDELTAAIAKANQFVVPNEYVRVIEENGATGFNASTGLDATQYYYSLPSNRAELWFLLQSEWLRQPVYREFYKERDVVREERRMRTESNPVGRLQEALIATAITSTPYRTVVGWASDIENLTVQDAQNFFKTYYVPGNITVAIAGDITGAEARRLAEKYFGPLPAGPLPPRVRTTEAKQEGEKRVQVESPSQPYVFIAWQRPDQHDKDDAVFDVLASILSSGRTGLLHKDLVETRRLALAAGAAPAFPGGKYNNLFLAYAVPGPGKTVEENERAIYEVIDQLKKEKVDETTLRRVKTKLRAGLIRQLDSNPGLASQLAFYHVNYGDWRVLFTAIDEIDKVTAEDVQRVAQQYLNKSTRTVAYIVPPSAKEAGK